MAGILAPSAGGSSPTTLTFGSSLTLATGSILDLTLSTNLNSGNDQVVMTGGNVLTLGTSGTVNINAPGGLSVGNYVLISNTGGTIAGGAGWTASVTGDAGHSYILGPQGTNFDLTVTSGASITWTGHTNGTWDVTTPNWTPNFTGTYTEGDLVTFNDSGSNTTGIQITGTGGNNTVSPAFMTFSNTLDAYSFTSGTIAGTGSVAINNHGTVTFLNTNTFTGGTSVTNGSTLNIGDAGLDSGSYASSVIAVSGTGSTLNVGTLGSLTATLGVSPSLVLGSGAAATFKNTSQTLGGLNGDSTTTLTLTGTALTVATGGTMDGLVSGTGSLTVSGGTLALTNGGNSYSGGTTITGGGTLAINTDGTTTGTNTPLGAVPGSPANNLFINGGTLQANGTYSLNANRSILLGPSSGIGSGTLAVTGSNVVTVPGTISNNGTSTAALIKTGTGTLILTGTSNTYSGGTVINGGTVQVNSTANIGSGGVTLGGGVTLVYQGAGGFFPGLTGQYWSNQNPGNSTFGFTNETDSANYFAGLPTATVNNLILPGTGNGSQGWNGGINFLNSNGNGANAFAPISVNVGNNNVDARWTGTINLAQPETITFSSNSDDASFVILSNGSGSPGTSPIPAGGEIVVKRERPERRRSNPRLDDHAPGRQLQHRCALQPRGWRLGRCRVLPDRQQHLRHWHHRHHRRRLVLQHHRLGQRRGPHRHQQSDHRRWREQHTHHQHGQPRDPWRAHVSKQCVVDDQWHRAERVLHRHHLQRGRRHAQQYARGRGRPTQQQCRPTYQFHQAGERVTGD